MIGYRVRRTDDQLRLVVEQDRQRCTLLSIPVRFVRFVVQLSCAVPDQITTNHELHESRDYWKDDRISRPTAPMITFASSLRSIYCVVLSPLSSIVKFQIRGPTFFLPNQPHPTTNLTNYTNQRLLEG